jgi:cyclopropane-fatty-acyl-phospholipid synthase
MICCTWQEALAKINRKEAEILSHERVKRTISSVIETLAPEFAVKLWDGTRIGPSSGPALLINDPGLLRQLILKPKLDTIIEGWISKAIDIEDGTLFDIVALRPKTKLKQQLKKLPKWQLLKDVPALLWSGGKLKDSGLAGANPYRSGSDKDAITHHYDVSNAFYQTFLDERMVYTCAYFRDWQNSIDQAQEDKLELICRKLRLKPGDTLLDIGCGWGAMLIYAAKHYGVTGHGVSLSEAQTALARERIKAEGFEDKITIHIKSYEQMEGQFDKISSIGMFEAVGLANYDTYFSSVQRLLKPGGLYLHHAISRRNKGSTSAFKRKRPEQMALAKYIFPGGELDHLAMTIGNLELHGFEVHDVENLREHYGRTCRLWAERLHANFSDAIKEAGEGRARLWLLYLTGCAIAFERGTVQINQTVASKRVRGVTAVPQTREDLYR